MKPRSMRDQNGGLHYEGCCCEEWGCVPVELGHMGYCHSVWDKTMPCNCPGYVEHPAPQCCVPVEPPPTPTKVSDVLESNWGADNDSVLRDAMRYRGLRLLGVAPCGAKQLANATVLRVTNLDEFADEYLKHYPIIPSGAITGQPTPGIESGFLVKVCCHTSELPSKQTPETLQWLIGKALEAHGYQEEVDFTLEVSRTYE